MIFVYVLKLSSDKHYTGITKNLIKRIKQHDSASKDFTSNFKIISLLYVTVCSDYKSARLLEIKIKRFGALKYVLKSKFADRYSINIPISDIRLMSDDKEGLNQLQIVFGYREHLINNL